MDTLARPWPGIQIRPYPLALLYGQIVQSGPRSYMWSMKNANGAPSGFSRRAGRRDATMNWVTARKCSAAVCASEVYTGASVPGGVLLWTTAYRVTGHADNGARARLHMVGHEDGVAPISRHDTTVVQAATSSGRGAFLGAGRSATSTLASVTAQGHAKPARE